MSCETQNQEQLDELARTAVKALSEERHGVLYAELANIKQWVRDTKEGYTFDEMNAIRRELEKGGER